MVDLSAPPAADAGLFGKDFDETNDALVIIGVPWEPTVSYGRGTSKTPKSLVPASHQLDFFDLMSKEEFGDCVGMLPLNESWVSLNEKTVALAEPIIEAGGAHSPQLTAQLNEVNRASQSLNEDLYEESRKWRRRGKVTAVLGGDHSSPLGHMKACLDDYPEMGVLHVDAHHDLRDAYEGFTYSHASIMFNLLKETGMKKLVSVGIRDFCKEEYEMARDDARIETFYDAVLAKNRLRGKPWHENAEAILAHLPKEVYISFDIDGLQPSFCPHTGTPVPGGLSFDEALYLLELLVERGHHIVGFDLCEVAPHPESDIDEWDLNVGARLLWHLARLTMAS